MPLQKTTESSGRVAIFRRAPSSSSGVVFYTIPAGRKFSGKVYFNAANSYGVYLSSDGIAISYATNGWEFLEIVGPATIAPSSNGRPEMFGWEE